MKKVFPILLLIPFGSFAQDPNVMKTQDVIINALLDNTFDYLEKRNDATSVVALKVPKTKEDSIDWDKLSLNKWKIIAPVDTCKITYD